MNRETLFEVSKWLVVATAIPQSVFVILYGTRSPWWRDTLGRALFVKSTGLAFSLDLVALFYWLGNYAWRPYVTLAGFSLITVGVWWQLIVFWRIRFRPGRPASEKPERLT